MSRTLLIVLAVCVLSAQCNVISTNCANNLVYASSFFDAVSSSNPLPLIRSAYASSYTGNVVSSFQPNMFVPIPTNIDDLMPAWEFFYNSWYVNSTTNEFMECFDDGRVLLRTSQVLTHKTTNKALFDSISWYILTFNTSGKIMVFEDTWNTLLVTEAGLTTQSARVSSLPLQARALGDNNCENITAALQTLGQAIANKNVDAVLGLFATSVSGITPSFQLPYAYVPVTGNTQASAWEAFFSAWNFDGELEFEIACSSSSPGSAFFRHQQNMTSIATGTKVYYSQSWYYITFNDDLEITRIDNTWNTLLESQASTPAPTGTTGHAESLKFSVVLLAILVIVTML